MSFKDNLIDYRNRYMRLKGKESKGQARRLGTASRRAYSAGRFGRD